MHDVFSLLGKKHGKKITFVLKGIHSDNMHSEKEKENLNKLEGMFKNLGLNYELHPYTKSGDWQQYYKDLSDLDLDIFFAPMKDDPSHEAKSELKYLEAAYVGAPIVVPAVGGHKHAIKHGINGLLVKSNSNVNEFVHSLDELILDTEKRFTIATNARQDILENYDVLKSSDELAYIFAEQLKRKKTRSK